MTDPLYTAWVVREKNVWEPLTDIDNWMSQLFFFYWDRDLSCIYFATQTYITFINILQSSEDFFKYV